ncbi:MAG: MFS transporter [Alistipes shahii]
MDTLTKPISAPRRRTTADTVYPILLLVSVTHLLNDMMQSVIPAVYPLLKAKFGFSFAQIGLITLVFQMTSSILQPFVGRYADRHPRPYSLAAGMCFTLAGLFALALAPGFAPILLAVALIGWGSSIFHPESSRVAQLASGGRKGLAQSIFQVGGNAGSAFGPLLAALVVIPYGQASIVLVRPGRTAWPSGILLAHRQLVQTATERHREPPPPVTATAAARHLPSRKIRRAHCCILTRAGLLEIFLHRLYDQLFHLLPYGQIRLLGAGRAIQPLRIPRGIGRRHGRRRAAGRPHRTEIRHLGLDPRGGALRPAAALRRIWHCTMALAILVGLDHLVGLLGHRGLRHRPDARPSGNDRRPLLRADVRPGRPRLGLLRLAGRPRPASNSSSASARCCP